MAEPHEHPDQAGVAIGDRLADRFVVRSQIGSGAFGVVYAAHDEQTDRAVALKHLIRVTGAAIYRFKKEFRALAGRQHGNLVRFHELFSEDGRWFFSMELVDGVPFDAWVLGTPTPTRSDAPTQPEARSAKSAARRAAAPDLSRLRAALAQLVAGVRELHAAGVVHRDLKPGNVLVTPAGRVVLLDFGLSAERDPDAQRSVLGIVMGTPTYMSPEQSTGRATTEASDWYSLGVLLYEVLHGGFHTGTNAQELLAAKMSPSTWDWPPPPPGAEDLQELCRALLEPDADKRPSGEDIARRVEARGTVDAARAPATSSFVGRTRELALLDDALATVEGSHTVVARVVGQSGVGKSALVHHFLDSRPSHVVTLRGRCYSRESVPYKAFDGVVDALTRYLMGLSVEEAALFVPREAQALCRVFPVFERLRLMSTQPVRRRPPSPVEERRRAFRALGEILARLGDRRAVVLFIDDLQWGDVDSLELFEELTSGEDAPRLLLIAAYRAEDADRSAVLKGLVDDVLAGSSVEDRELEVGPLGEAEASELARSLLPDDEQGRAEELARESGGIPVFLPELARARRGGPVSLEETLARRMATLSDGARRLLEVVAVAGHPTSASVAARAAGLEETNADEATWELVHEQLLRRAADRQSSLEAFHDRVREGVVAQLPEDRQRATHAALADALAAHGDADPVMLAEHYRLAGRLEEARPAAIEAAERASHAFAFDRAVELYRVAQEGAPSSERRLLSSALAEMLAYAGRGREAADTYLAAVAGADPDDARELKRRALEQLFRCGAIGEAIAMSRELLADAGIAFPEKRGAVVASVALQRIRLRLRGLRFVEREIGPDDETARFRVDLLHSVSAGLRIIDIIRGAELQTRLLREALDLGDPARIANGFAVAAVSTAAEGKHDEGEQLAMRTFEIGNRIGNAHVVGSSFGARAAIDFMAARWRRSLKQVEELSAILQVKAPDRIWELPLADVFVTLRSLFFLGEIDALDAEVERVTRSAEERNDTVVVALSRAVGGARLLLARGDLDAAREASEWGIAGYDGGDWHLPHQEGLRAQLWCDLYAGDGDGAAARMASTWAAVKGSFLLRSQAERVLSFPLYAYAALLAGDEKAAGDWVRKLAKERHPLAEARVTALRAALAARRGGEGAAEGYARAAASYDALEMAVFAAAARRRRGELLGGDEGEEIVRAADELLASRGVADPAVFARATVA